MAKEFRLKDPGEGIHEAEILELHVAAGDHVTDGDDLITVETDKAAVVIPAPFTGTIEEIRVKEGEVATVGDVIITYRQDDGQRSDAEPSKQGGDDKDETPKDETPKGDTKTAKDTEPETPTTEDDDESGEDAGDEEESTTDTEPEAKDEDTHSSDQGSSRAGKLRLRARGRDRDAGGTAEEEGKEDEGKEDEGKEDKDKEDKDKPEKDEGQSGGPAKDDDRPQSADEDERRSKVDNKPEDREQRRDGPVPASPAARRLARELGVSLRELSPSGPEDRVTAEDVRAAAGGGRGKAAAPTLPDFSRWGEIERVPLRSIRRATARQMSLAWSEIPHVMNMDVADVTELERFRRGHQAATDRHGGKLTLTVLLLKAVAALLKDFPRFNASLDTEAGEIVLKHYYHIGVAVQTERGLLVPVLRDVDRKSVAEVAAELAERVEQAHAGELKREAMQGGTFTLTNPGPIGGVAFTPIIRHPEVAILGLGRAALQPVARGTVDDPEITARMLLPLCLAFDHRVIDGAEAAEFCSRLIGLLAEPESLLLHL